MANPNLIMTLSKVMVAAAWADGAVAREEINALKDLLFQLPELTAEQWAQLDIYIETPVTEAERTRLVEDLRNAIWSEDDKKLAVQMIDELIHADGEVTPEEEAVAAEIKSTLNETETGIIGGLSKLVGGAVGRRSAAVANAPNREHFIEDFIRNRVYYGVQQRLNLGEGDLNIPEDKLRRLSLAGGLMSAIAWVDEKITDEEHAAITSALQTHWGISETEAALVAEVTVSDLTRNLDPFRTAREFVNVCEHEECERFVDALFAIAAADGMATNAEIEEIRSIARTLKLTHQQFINAKLKIPAANREA